MDGDARASVAPGTQLQFVPGTLYWVAAERHSGYKFGDHVPGVVAVAVKGVKSVHVTADGNSMFH